MLSEKSYMGEENLLRERQDKAKKSYLRAGVYFLLFLLLTICVKFVNVQPIGPNDSKIGLATLNGLIRDLIGYHETLDQMVQYLGYLSMFVGLCFAAVGLMQWIRRKRFRYVDTRIVLQGLLFAAAIALYVLFEIVVINYRPILVDGVLEASYPSSHTMMIVCIMGSAIIQFNHYISTQPLRTIADVLALLVAVLSVILRLLSGVHWFTDIVGGVLLAAALLYVFRGLCERYGRRRKSLFL